MRKYIEKIKAKPEEIRKQIFAGVLILCMVLVGFVWVEGLINKTNGKKVAIAEKEASATIGNSGSKPFVLFGQVLKSTYNNITASVGDISNTIKNEKSKIEKEGLSDEEEVIDLAPIEYSE